MSPGVSCGDLGILGCPEVIRPTRISIHVMAENWQLLKSTFAFSSFLRVLLTSDLLSNISLFVG